jgi:hypothetical protein
LGEVVLLAVWCNLVTGSHKSHVQRTSTEHQELL